MPQESLIEFIAADFTFGFENTQIDEDGIFQWTDGTVKFAQGASSNIGQCAVPLFISGQNAESETGNPTVTPQTNPTYQSS